MGGYWKAGYCNIYDCSKAWQFHRIQLSDILDSLAKYDNLKPGWIRIRPGLAWRQIWVLGLSKHAQFNGRNTSALRRVDRASWTRDGGIIHGRARPARC
jgi:hypothetical protein